MKRAAVFFDRDNTLIANDGYLGDPNGVVLVEGAAGAVARARELGYAVVVFSNQSGVARGMFAEEAVHAVNQRMDEMLLDEDGRAVIDRHEFCPYHPEAAVERYRQDSDLRKPKPGMILQAERQLALDLPRSWVLGDAPRDIDAGKAAGCRTILVKNAALAPSEAASQAGEAQADFEVGSLREAMEVIERNPAPTGENAPEPATSMEQAAPAAAPAPAPEPEREPVRLPEAEQTPDHAPTPEPEPTAEAVPTAQTAVAAERIVPRVSTRVAAVEADEPASVPMAAVAPGDAPADNGPDDDHDGGATIPRGKSRQEILLSQILDELRRRHEHPENDFSVSKLVAGIVQVLALAALFYAYLNRDKLDGTPGMAILTGIFLQVFTIALLIMGKQK